MPMLEKIKMQCRQLVMILVVLLTGITYADSQSSSQYDKGTPPQHAAGVSSLGSYTSTDLGTINLSNGALNIKLPLAFIGGRGFSLPLTLNYSSKVWSASRESNFADETGYHPVSYAKYADIETLVDSYGRIAPGWTIGAVPTLVLRGNGIKDNPTSTCIGDYRYALTKLTVILPDKGEIELRDDATNGAPLATQNDPSTNCMSRDGNRGQRWHASDGSGIVFISDTTNGIVRGDLNGVLILGDGTRYRFASLYNPPAGSPPLDVMSTVKLLARGTSIVDRNGNMITITYPAANEVRYTDQLGRVTKIQKSVPDPDTPSINLAALVTVPGYQGQDRYFKIKSEVMNQRYRDGINPTTPVINGDYDPLGWGLSWGSATRLFPHSHGLDAERIDVQTVLSDFILPDGRAMQFFYNEFGEVAEVQLPTGGKLQYDYQYVSTLPAGKSHVGEVITSYFDSNVSDVDRSVVARRTYADGSTLEGSWIYSYTTTTTEVTAFSASGSVLLNQKHYFLAAGRYLNSPSGTGPVPDRGSEGTGYSLWSTGVEARTETLDAAGTTVIAATEQDWTQRISLNWVSYTTYAQEQPENDNRLNQERRYLDNGMMAKTETIYDQYNNPIDFKEYDFDQTLKRRTTTSYISNNLGFNYQTDDSIHLIRLPETVITYDGNNNQKAKTVTEYDIYTNDGNHAAITDYSLVSQHDSSYNLSKITRGNVTRIGAWLNTTNSFIYSYPRYDKLGNVVATKDALGNITTVNFADDFGNGTNPGTPAQNPATPTFAFPTLITSPPPLPGAGVHTANSQYDYSTGLLTGFRDRNNVVTQTIYNDPFDRPTLVKSALGVAGVETHTVMYYAPITVFGITLTRGDVLTASDQTTVDDAMLRSWIVTDGFGRTTESWKRDPQGDVRVITNYDALGRVKQTSNPFRSSETADYTTTAYDLLGRVIMVTTPDNSVVATNYVGNTVTVTDQAGKKRKSVTDGLGRLIEVYEDPDVSNLFTTYQYDTLDNLKKGIQDNNPQQPEQPPREFIYDSLKRLTSATNPESGIVTYDYHDDGSLFHRTDARGVVTTYVYDALGRNISITYTNDPSGTLPVTRVYDAATNGIGRLHKSQTTGTNGSLTTIDEYDALGRPKTQRQQFYVSGAWSQSYQMQRTYDLAGDVKSQSYPSGYPSAHIVNYDYDSAGRLNNFTGKLGDGTTRTYSTGITYASAGQLKQEQFGTTTTAIYNKLFYNSRQQLAEILVSTTVGDTWDRGKILNQYSLQCSGAGCNATDNNGNLRKQEVFIPDGTSWYQQYEYDNLNRLKRVHEYTGNPALDWQQEYDYDRWGNRTLNAAGTWLGSSTNPPNALLNETQFETNDLQFTNRLYAPGDLQRAENDRLMRYDAAGNLIKDIYTGAGNREYDAENRMTRAWGGNNQWQSYGYDADGHRVRRTIDGVETWQIYGFDGEVLAEYPANSAAANPTTEYGYRNGQLLIKADSGNASAPPVFGDDFNDNSLNTNSWSTYYPPPPTVSEQGQQLQVTLPSNTAAYNGVYSNTTYDLTGRMVQVELPQAVSQAGWCENFIELELNANNYFMIQTGVGNLLMRSRVNGVNDQTSIPFNATAHRFWRVRHDQSANLIYFETSANDTVWVSRKTVTPGFSLSSLRIHLLAGCYGAGNSNPGTIKYDNVKLLATTAGSTSITVPNAGFEAPVVGNGSFQYSPAGGSWTFANGGGISGMNSGFTGTPSAAPEGVQIAFIQATGEISQSISGFQANTNYVITFSAAQRTNCCNSGGQDIQVYLDTDPKGTFHPSSGVYAEYSTAAFTTSAGTHTVKFRGVDPLNIGVTAFIDNVRINGSPKPGFGVQWLVTDQLGTARMVFDESGSLANIKRHDYLPFGEELTAGTGGRTTAQGYSASDGVRQQFTQKERDIETGLDYFLARYYSSTQGRFTSVDPENAGADESDPQSWNGYSYTRNTPTILVDPDGREFQICYGKDDCHTYSDKQFNQIKTDATKLGSVFKNGAIYNEVNGQMVVTATYIRTDTSAMWDQVAPQLGARLEPVQKVVTVGAIVSAGVIAAPIISLELGAGGLTTLGLAASKVLANAAKRLPNLTGLSRIRARLEMEKLGFRRLPNTGGGYERWKHPDGSEIQIRPNGEVVRTGPSQPKADGTGNFKPRIDPTGQEIPFKPGGPNTHNTGEIVH